MFLSYQVMATFGVSALLSFAVSVTLLLMVVAGKGYLRAGAGVRPKGPARALLPPQIPAPIIAELTPLKQKF